MTPNHELIPVVADIGLVQRVLENLLRNALQYTPRGGSVSVSVTPQQEKVTVAVSDTGRGFPGAALPQIFDRFYRGDTNAAAESASSGLGLAIVKRILDLHGSRIVVTSGVDRGTRFEFDLPTRVAA